MRKYWFGSAIPTLAYLRKVLSLGVASSLAAASRAGAFFTRAAILEVWKYWKWSPDLPPYKNSGLISPLLAALEPCLFTTWEGGGEGGWSGGWQGGQQGDGGGDLGSNLPLACVPPAWPPLHLGKLMEILSVSDLPTSGPTAQMLRFPEMKGLMGLFECIV